MDVETRSKRRPLLAFLGFAAATALTAVVGSRATLRGKEPWYRLIRKSRLNPPDAVFAPVWTALFVLTAISGYRVWRAAPSPARTRALGLWTAQLVLNASWSRLFFGQHRPTAAFVDLGALLFTLGGYTREAARIDRPAAYLMAPYLGWVGFAGYLNEEVIRKNPRFVTA